MTDRARRGRRVLTCLLQRDPAAIGAISVLAVALVAALSAPLLPLPDPLAIDVGVLYAPLGTPGHALGTDELGRDVLSRLVWGGRTSLVIPLAPLIGALTLGGVLGIVAGYFGGMVDGLVMRVLDVVLAFPTIVLAIGVAAALGSGLENTLFAIGVVEVPIIARIARSVTLSVRTLDYVLAARALGTPTIGVLRHHVVPNVLSPLLVFGTLEFGHVIILTASLSFLGLGVRLPAPDWGSMLDAGRKLLLLAPHVSVVPGVAILTVTLSVNILGDLLRDALDPRGRAR